MKNKYSEALIATYREFGVDIVAFREQYELLEPYERLVLDTQAAFDTYAEDVASTAAGEPFDTVKSIERNAKNRVKRLAERFR